MSAFPTFPGLRIFNNGVSNVTQFAAHEYRSMMKVILMAIVGTFAGAPLLMSV